MAMMKDEKAAFNLEESIKGLMGVTIHNVINENETFGPWANAETVPMEAVKKICQIVGEKCYLQGLEHGSTAGQVYGKLIRVEK